MLAWYINRDDLTTAITNFSPASIDSAIDMVIALGEQTADRDINARGGIKYAETVTNSLVTAANTETITLPTDFRSASVFMLTTDPFQVLVSLNAKDLFATYTSSTVTGKPEAFAVVGTNTAYLRYVPDGIYTTRLIYKAALTPLSATNTSNWLLANGLQVLLGACMLELCMLLENEERLQFWKGYYDQKMNDFMGDDRMTRWTAVDARPNIYGAIA